MQFLQALLIPSAKLQQAALKGRPQNESPLLHCGAKKLLLMRMRMTRMVVMIGSSTT
jgi:hypothetical protein